MEFLYQQCFLYVLYFMLPSAVSGVVLQDFFSDTMHVFFFLVSFITGLVKSRCAACIVVARLLRRSGEQCRGEIQLKDRPPPAVIKGAQACHYLTAQRLTHRSPGLWLALHERRAVCESVRSDHTAVLWK